MVGLLRARRREAREETPATGENGAGTKASSDRACAAARMTAVPKRRRGWAVAPAPEPRFLAHAVAAEQRASIHAAMAAPEQGARIDLGRPCAAASAGGESRHAGRETVPGGEHPRGRGVAARAAEERLGPAPILPPQWGLEGRFCWANKFWVRSRGSAGVALTVQCVGSIPKAINS